jgi:glyceraldehyde 3-phosphate dehydrogenase
MVKPDTEIRFDAISMSVPVADVSLLDLTVNIKTDATYEEVCGAVAMAADGEFSGIVKYLKEQVVSSDILNERANCCFDSKAGANIGHRLFKLLAWYDNESVYAKNLLDLSSFIMNQ